MQKELTNFKNEICKIKKIKNCDSFSNKCDKISLQEKTKRKENTKIQTKTTKKLKITVRMMNFCFFSKKNN